MTRAAHLRKMRIYITGNAHVFKDLLGNLYAGIMSHILIYFRIADLDVSLLSEMNNKGDFVSVLKCFAAKTAEVISRCDGKKIDAIKYI